MYPRLLRLEIHNTESDIPASQKPLGLPKLSFLIQYRTPSLNPQSRTLDY